MWIYTPRAHTYLGVNQLPLLIEDAQHLIPLVLMQYLQRPHLLISEGLQLPQLGSVLRLCLQARARFQCIPHLQPHRLGFSIRR